MFLNWFNFAMFSTTKDSSKNVHSLARESVLNLLTNSLPETLSFLLAVNLILNRQFLSAIVLHRSWLIQ